MCVWGGGGGLLQRPQPPLPQLFSRQKFLKNASIDTWVSAQKVDKLSRKNDVVDYIMNASQINSIEPG